MDLQHACARKNIILQHRAAPQCVADHWHIGVCRPISRFEGASPGAATCVCGVWRAGVWIVSRIFAGHHHTKNHVTLGNTHGNANAGCLHDCARTCAPPQHCVGHCTLSGVTVLVINNGHARQLACARAECNCTRCWAECTCVVSSRYGTLAPSAIHPPHARSTTPTARTTQLPRAPNPPSVYQ